MTHSATLDRLCVHALVLRLHPGPHGRVGDPFVWACAVESQEGGDLAVLHGAPGAPPGGPRPVLEALARDGFRRVAWRRIRGGRERWVEFDLGPGRD